MKEQASVAFHLDFQYADEKKYALHQAEGTVGKGKCVVLCGGSGCGKSTLLRCVNRLIPQFYEGTLHGFCHINGTDADTLTIGEAGKLAASVFQDPRSQFFTLNSSTELAFGLENFGFSQKEMKDRIDKAFRSFHLEDLKDRNVFALSSGERQLIAILSAWAMDPDIFLLDEPTANLDQEAILQLKKALSALKNDGKTLLISEHRLYYLAGIADEYWLMEEGCIKKRFFASEMQSMSPESLAAMGLRITDFYSVHQKISDPVEITVPKVKILAQDITFRYPKTKEPIVKGFSMQMETGEVIGLIGRNGCGKTTFGKLLAGLYAPSSGTFFCNGRAIRTKDLCTQSIFVMQEAEFQFFTNSVFSEVTYGCPDTSKEEIKRLLQQAGLWEFRRHHPCTLSGGQMQRLALLLACVSPKSIVVLDEPTAGLDAKSLASCIALVKEMQKRKSILIITHDPELIAGVCTRCIDMEQGKAVQSFDLRNPSAFPEVLGRMQPTGLVRKDTIASSPMKKRHLLDPRTKLMLLLASMIVGIGADPPMQISVLISLLIASGIEGHFPVLASGIGGFFFLLILYRGIPCVATSFMWYFFLRVLVIGAAASLLLFDGEAARTLAGLRRLRVPERAVMVCSVMLRFFPVLSADLRMMSQAIKTRGFFPSLSDKLRSIPSYLEIMIVPLVFRVIRIAEALSASAETRGISLKGRRDSYLSVQFSWTDLWMFLILVCAMAGSFIISNL